MLTFLLVVSTIIQAQDVNPYRINSYKIDSKVESWSKVFTIEPAFTFIHGLKLNFDIPLKSEGHYLIAQPILFYNNNDNVLFESRHYESMQGFGLQAGHRIYLQPQRFLNSTYFQYNALVHRFKTNHDELNPIEFVEDGVTYSRFEQSKFSKTFTKTGFDVLFGKQFFMDDLFLFDLFLGVGFRYTLDDKFNQFTDFSDYGISIGYSGIILNGGIRIGIVID